MTKNAFIFFIFLSITLGLSTLSAQTFSDISLPPPLKTGGKPLREALNERQTKREFSDREFTMQELSDMLWAVWGVNRPESGKRTAPSAMNKQEIDMYVALKSGVYLYDATAHVLKAITAGDHRKDMGTQPFVGTAPLVLVFVADYARMSDRSTPERKDFYAGTDTGYISQNVYLYASSEGLATVALGSFDKDIIARIIPLTEKQRITLTQPVGFAK